MSWIKKNTDSIRIDSECEGMPGNATPLQSENRVNLEATVVIGDGGNHFIEGLPSKGIGEIPDIELDWGKHGKVHIRAASVRGRLHRHEASLRQDAFALGFCKTQQYSYSIAAVADGVGSLPLSHLAASSAARGSVGYIKTQLQNGVDGSIDLSAVFSSALASVDNEASRVSSAEVQMACTLTVAIVRTSNTSCGTVTNVRILSVGDSSVWTLLAKTLTRVTPNTISNSIVEENKVSAIPFCRDGWESEVEFNFESAGAIFLMTDGLSEPLGSGDSLLGQYLVGSWEDPPSPFEFGHTLDFARRSHLDDRTAVGLWVK